MLPLGFNGDATVWWFHGAWAAQGKYTNNVYMVHRRGSRALLPSYGVLKMHCTHILWCAGFVLLLSYGVKNALCCHRVTGKTSSNAVKTGRGGGLLPSLIITGNPLPTFIPGAPKI